MPKIFARIPFWVWPIIGVACVIMSIPGFLAWSETSARSEALAAEMPELADLGSFNPETDAGLYGEVHVFAQTNPEFTFTIDSSGLRSSQRFMVPLFTAEADANERNVQTVILVEDEESFKTWLSDNVAGNARIGDLYAINGRVIDGQGFTAAVKVTLRDAGLNQAETITIIEPFVNGREAALGGETVARFGNPIVLLIGGLYLIGIGILIFKKSLKVRQEVASRYSALSPSIAGDEIAVDDLPKNVEPFSKAVESIKKSAKESAKKKPSGAKNKTSTEQDLGPDGPKITAAE